MAARAVYHLEFRPYRRKFRIPIATAHGVWTFREGIIVRLTDNDGRFGYGEVAPVPGFTRETAARDLAWLCRVENRLTDADINQVPPRLACVRGALQCARAMLEDKCPVPVRSRLSVAALLPAGRSALSALPRLLRQGFRIFKWKVGVGGVAEELRILEKLLRMLPRGGKLRLDANGGLSAREWKIWQRGINVLAANTRATEFFEQPVSRPPNFATSVPIALDESVVGFNALRRAHGAGWPGPLVVKPSLLGDWQNFGRWRVKAKADLIYSSAFETSVGLHAALLLAASDPRAGARALGFGTLGAFADDDLQLPEHKLGPAINVRRIAPEKFSAIWERLPSKV